MSIYLRLDRAPEVCDFCRSQQRDQGVVWCPICGKIGSKDFVCCPIVEIPPHGRLIDADALKAKQQEDADLFINAVSLEEKSRRDEALNAVANIVNAPTIIPEERGDNGERRSE